MKKASYLLDKSLVIQKYLQGKSMDKIAKETGISKGKVHYLIRDWKDKISIPNIEEIRDFIDLVKKSSLSIEQCAQGFRMMNLLKKFGIDAEISPIQNVDNNSDNNVDDNNDNYKQFSTFVVNIYENCKKLNIPPDIIPSWIKDMLDFSSSKSTSSTLYSNNQSSLIDIDENESDIDDIVQSSSSEKINEFTQDFYKDADKKLDSNINNESKSDFFINDGASNLAPNPVNNYSLSASDIEIPFISQISFYIDQKKKEISILNNHQKTIEKDIQSLQNQKSIAIENLKQITAKEKFVISYIKWFYNLEKALLEGYSIHIKNEIERFSHLINDFKEHGYDAYKIIQEYTRSLSIKLEIETEQGKLRGLQKKEMDLITSLSILESKVCNHRITMDTYTHLEGMSFGLKELRQLWDTVREIAYANNIPSDEVVSKFFKDVKEQYDKKLGFEPEIKEKEKELYNLKNQLNAEKIALNLQPHIVPSLQQLFQNGVTDEDIINMNHLITKFAKNSYPLNIQNDNDSNDSNDKKDNNLMYNFKADDRSKYWKSFIGQLEKLQDIKLSIKEQMDYQNKIQKEVIDLEKQKKEISIQCHIAVALISTINSKISYFEGFMDAYNRDKNNKINSSSRLSPLPFFIIVNKNTGKEKEEDGDELNKEENNNM
jgi:hypothetical protein